MLQRVELIVGGPDFKVRLEDFLLGQFSTVSKMYLRELVKNGFCEVNGRHENIGRKLFPNDFVEIMLDADRGTAMRPEQIELDIPYEDEHLLVVNKPEGMLVHPSHYENSGTLLNGLVYHLNQNIENGTGVVRPGLIHRLDKHTSGLVVIGKNPRAHRLLCRAFMNKRVEKLYLALVEGVVEDDTGVIEAPIGRFPDLKLWGVKEDGKPAETRYQVVERRSDTTLLELEPVTGRTNQLRIHCEALGHPIVGDTVRGGRDHSRLCLHALRLSFPHPVSREQICVQTEISFHT